jgi:hypothetical protein
MTEYQKRRQKAQLKKRRKEKERRKKQSRSSSYYEYAQSAYLIKNAKNYPVHECLINDDWQDKGMAHIFLTRKQPNNTLILGVYLVDIFCLGLKNTFKLIKGAIEYARRLGFKPQEDFDISQYVLEGLPDSDSDIALEFGKDGKPLYIAGPDDDFEAIIETLRKNVGEDNFHFIAPLH